MTDKISPTQMAYDRLQQAGTRSPMIVGDIMITFELRSEGIRICGVRPGFDRYHIVTWSELALSKTDPLMALQKQVLADLLRHGGIDHADS